MDENLHNIDDLFRKALEHHNEVPTAKVWENLDKNLEKKKVVSITKKYKKWKWVAAALFIFSFGMAMYTVNLKMRYKEVAKGNKVNTTGVKKTTNNSGKTAAPAELANNETVGGLEDKRAAETNFNNSQTEVKRAGEDRGEAKPKVQATQNKKESAAEDIASRDAVYTTKKDIENKNRLAQKGIDKKESVRQNNGKKDQKLNEALVKASSVKRAIDKLATKIVQTTTIGENSSNNARLPIAPEQPFERITLGRVLAQLSRQTVQKEAPLIVNANKQRLQLPQVPTTKIKTHKTENSSAAGYSISGFFSRDFISNNLKNDRPPSREDDRREIKKTEENSFSYSAGILLEKIFARNFSIQTGLGISTRTTDINPKIIFARPDRRGEINYRLSCSAGYAYISTKSGTRPAPGDSIKSVAAKTTLQYFSIPVAVNYIFSAGRFIVKPGLQFSTNIKTLSKIETELVTARGNETNSTNNIEGLRSAYYDAGVKLELAYSVNKNIGFSLIPSTRFALSSITKDAPVKTYYNSFGVAAGLSIKL